MRFAAQAARRCIIDCLWLCEDHAEGLSTWLQNWRHVIPTGLVALLQLKAIVTDFPVDNTLDQKWGLAEQGPLKNALQVEYPSLSLLSCKR